MSYGEDVETLNLMLREILHLSVALRPGDVRGEALAADERSTAEFSPAERQRELLDQRYTNARRACRSLGMPQVAERLAKLQEQSDAAETDDQAWKVMQDGLYQQVAQIMELVSLRGFTPAARGQRPVSSRNVPQTGMACLR